MAGKKSPVRKQTRSAKAPSRTGAASAGSARATVGGPAVTNARGSGDPLVRKQAATGRVVEAYKTFRDKKDGSIKVVLHP